MPEAKAPEARSVDTKPLTQEEFVALSPEDRCIHLASALLHMVSVSEYREGGYVASGTMDGEPWVIDIRQEGEPGTAAALLTSTMECTALRQSAEAIGDAAETIHAENGILRMAINTLLVGVKGASSDAGLLEIAGKAQAVLDALSQLGESPEGQ